MIGNHAIKDETGLQNYQILIYFTFVYILRFKVANYKDIHKYDACDKMLPNIKSLK